MSARVPSSPSAFADWVSAQISPHARVVEFGFGNARDALWFAGHGRRVLGYDFAVSAVEGARQQLDTYPQTEFTLHDLYDSSASSRLGAELGDSPDNVIYGRFLLHALRPAGRGNFFDLCARALRSGGQLFVEFRTDTDVPKHHEFGDDHFRAYLNADQIQSEIEERGGSVSLRQEGHGLAVFRGEDPYVTRLVAHWT